ncbi:sodium/glutamate symporter [Liberiplasma polymorphum]|uniref:sodium/glutamate symporter n=1 Tax=Liberiplasma polymorphum TaxID=3374570 RepID=UPI003771903A
MNANVIGFSILLISVGLVIAKLIRIRFNIFSKYFLPSSVIAGFLFLLLGKEVLGKLFLRFERFEHLEFGIFTENIIEVFSSLPGLLISVIFASLFIGKKIPNLKEIWMTAGPQVSYGQTVAWGQYVIGILLALFILVPLLGADPMVGALIEIAFEGGHGTAAGLGSTFDDLGFSDGTDLALGLATVGVVSGVIFGVFLINWGVRTNKTNYLKDPSELNESDLRGVIDKESRESSAKLSVSPESIEPLALHLGMIGIAILIGKGLLELLILLENATWGANGNVIIMAYVPLFPLAMIGGVILQLILMKFDRFHLVEREMIIRLQGLALDFLIVSAVATLSLQVIGQNIWIFLILALAGISWNIFAFLYLARKMIPKNWFERGIGDFGQSMGMTAAGLMLIRIVDSKGDTKALEAFGYKQLLFEPFVGGGIMTAVSVPLIYNFGLVPILIFVTIVMIGWILLGLLYFGRKDASEIN